MKPRQSIRIPVMVAILAAAGCTSPLRLHPSPLAQDELDRFLDGGRDARVYGITTYQDAAGPRFEFANRPQSFRTAQLPFESVPGVPPVPIVRVETPLADEFPVLLDSSARQSWAVMDSMRGLEFRVFKPPTGEYADHVVASIPGYAGVGNQLILGGLYIQNPVFYMPPARGGLGVLARTGENPDRTATALIAWERAARRMPSVVGAALMRGFHSVRFDFPDRRAAFSTAGPYQPTNPAAVLDCVPLYDWRGRPAVAGELDGAPVTLVLDTAGDFDISVPGDVSGSPGTLRLGTLQFTNLNVATHARLGLPETFPARLGLGVLARHAVTLDFQQQRVWFEGKPLRGTEKSATSTGDDTPVHYRGITR
ncbi:MAG: hypothetical protein KBC66_05655 [Kiritimatiellae bacterium]|nr:hypothetical protein [Kiritimatiellia bacterium]NLD90408.1 hypothetical protein [Lentisphaerota bacterium]HOU21630.1 hypothetical protein [Kiritimatiellia bacterium]HPC20728.1 hypothetical protein [Kiritimatiellia bacterium]